MSPGILPSPARTRQALRGTLCLAMLFISACSIAPRAPSTDTDAELRVAGLIAEGQHREAANRLEALAVTSLAARRDDVLAMAAEQWLLAGERERAAQALRRIDVRRLSVDGRGRVAVVRGRSLRLDGELVEAAGVLAIDPTPLSADVRAALHLERAELAFAANQPRRGIEQLVLRDRYLSDQTRRRAEQRRIWDALVRLRSAVASDELAPAADPVFVRWVELLELVRGAWQDPSGAQAALSSWAERNSSHPAAAWLVPELLGQLAQRDTYPPRIALLLPLTGRYASLAQAVRDGAVAARFGIGSDAPELLLFDTGDQPGGASRARDAALAAGADFLIGPLTKEAVTELVAAGAPPVPQLALNYLDGDAASPHRFWQFGLSPEGEAQQAAEHAIAQGWTRGIVLFPRGDWGQRMLRSFELSFLELGGTLLTAQMFDPVESDYSTTIMRALNIDESRSRAQLLSGMLGTRLENEPRRRQDAQFVFIAARDREAPLLRTQLRFHRATTLPVLATSHVYRVDGRADADLDGIRFADMPWTIGADDATRALRERLAAAWPETFTASSRLYALGFDALRLAPMLANFPVPLAEPVPGATGVLSMQSGNRLRRELFWAEFVQGLPRPERDAVVVEESLGAEPPATEP